MTKLDSFEGLARRATSRPGGTVTLGPEELLAMVRALRASEVLMRLIWECEPEDDPGFSRDIWMAARESRIAMAELLKEAT